MTIMDELNILKGSMNISGDLSYSGQEAWVFSATVKDNILFGESYNETRYNNVLTASCLSEVRLNNTNN